MDKPMTAPLACPDDFSPLAVAANGLLCRRCGRNFTSFGGVIGLLPRQSLREGTAESRQLVSYGATYSQRPDRPVVQPFRELITRFGNAYLYSWVRRSIEKIAAHRSLAILDAACGEGILRRYVPQRHHYTGVDFSSRPLERAFRYHPADYFRADLTRLPFASATFDLVISIQALQYLQDPALAVSQIARVLKPGGHFLVSVPNAASIKYRCTGTPSVQLREFRRNDFLAMISDEFEVKELDCRGLWLPMPIFSIHIAGKYREVLGLSWTSIGIRKG